MPNLKSLEKEVSGIYYKKGLDLFEKQRVREIDEEGSGNFVAFVDEGKISHDVQVAVNTKTFEILSHSCDCSETTPFCQHKVAVALQIAKKGTKTSDAISKKLKVKKKSKEEILLEPIPEIELKAWLLQQLQEDKSLSFKFFYRFEQKEATLEIKEILAKTHEIVKAVLGKSKHLDLNRLMAILALWKPYHDEVFDTLLPKIHQPEYFNILLTTINTIGAYKLHLNTSSNKLEKYMERLTEKFLERLNTHNMDEKLAVITNMIKSFEYDGVLNYQLPYAGLLATETISEPKKTELVQLFAAVIQPKIHYLESRVVVSLFEGLQKMGKFNAAYSLFKPLYAQDNYNLAVIDELVKIDKLVDALEFANRCMNNNSYEEYNIPYFQKKALIHSKMNQPMEALQYRIMLLPLTLDIEELASIFGEPLDDSTRRSLMAKINTRINGRTNLQHVIEFKMAYYELSGQTKKIQNCLPDDFEWRTKDSQLAPAIALDPASAIERIVQIYVPGNYFAENSAYFTTLLHSIEPKALLSYVRKIKYVPTYNPYYKVLQDYIKHNNL